MNFLFFALLLCLFFQTFLCSSSYRAIVVEYAPITVLDFPVPNRSAGIQLMRSNIQQIQNLLHQHFQNSSNPQPPVDIIVLPEDGLYGAYFKNKEMVLNLAEPIPLFPTNPCNNSSMKLSNPILYDLSCLAKEFSSYLVADMADVQSDSFVYNTQVAFDREGNFLIKYHKSHLYYEAFFTQGNQEEVAYFDTDFGVRIGMFICFDMMFLKPAQIMLQNLKIRDFAYSSWWVNFPPLINAIQMQQAWSDYHKVNLLASNSGYSWRISGSGIYSQGNPLSSIYQYNSLKSNYILDSLVPILPKTKVHLMRRPDYLETTNKLQNNSTVELQYESFITSPNLSRIIEKATSKIRCRIHFQVSASSNSTAQEMYAAYAISGYVFPVFEAEVCGIIKCGATKQDCDSIFNFQKLLLFTDTMFDFVHLEATKVDQMDPSPLYPLSSQNGMQLIDWNKQTIQHSLQQSTLKISNANILASALFGIIGG